jgi:hypothetical protein
LGKEIADKRIRFLGGTILIALRSTGIILLTISHKKPLPSVVGDVKASVNIRRVVHGLCGIITVLMLLEVSKQEGYRNMTSDKQLQFMATQDKLLQHRVGPTYICNYIQVFVKPVRN